jgi:hypothetical protein
VNWLIFIATQFVILGPILFFVLLYLLISPRARATLTTPREVAPYPKGTLLLSFVWPLFVVMSIEGLVANAHGNWAAPIYIAGSVAATAYLLARHKITRLTLSFLLNLVIIAGLYSVETWVKHFHIHLPLSMTQTHWDVTGEEIRNTLQQQGYHDLLVDNRMLLAQTLYFTKLPQSQLFKWNPSRRVKDQYDMMTDLNRARAGDFLLITYRAKPLDILQHFRNYRYLSTLKVSTLDGRGVNLYLYGLDGYSK